ncbi:MAG: hypothetical protein JSU59_03290 [Nitrospirota bacterium]|nr:MAG: hypothetical protein JSU59_03290 [Nitrospirota bacterium]
MCSQLLKGGLGWSQLVEYFPMTVKDKNWFKTTCLVVFLGFLVSIGACSWTPQIETELHNSSQGIVLLRTIEDSSLRANHPVDIKTTTMEQILRGAHTFRDPRLIEGLITDDDKPKRLFSPTQIGFLAPLLSSALAQATQEEEVLFQCTSDYEGAPPIKGNILVHDSTLYFRWKESLSKPNVLAKQHRRTTGLMDPSMPQGHMITFFPNEAIRVQDDSTKYYLKRLGENTLAIDYVVLAGLPKAVFDIPELQEEDGESTAKEDSPKSEDQPSAGVRTSENPTTADTSETPSDANSDIRALREQMEQLQREVDQQQEELDRIKKDQP